MGGFWGAFNLNLLTKFVAPGLYELDLENSALGFGERPKYQVEAVKFLGAFTELAANT